MSKPDDKSWKRLWRLKPFATTDSVVLKGNTILLMRRATKPFKGCWALPGGLMNVGETIEQCALREVREETGTDAKIIRLIGVYSGAKRDPRGTTISAAFLMKFVTMAGKHDDEALDVRFFPIDKIPERLAFDHKYIIRDALRLLRDNEN